MRIEDSWIDGLLDRALAEDLGREGDITSKAIFPDSPRATAVIKSKDAGVVSGIYLLNPLFRKIDPRVVLAPAVEDGAPLEKGTQICTLDGPITAILAGERIALNFLQHLSGIASAASRLQALIAHTPARLLDTRKTTPGLRMLEKKAVADGGGTNHRIGLYDMILIKDTHVTAAGGVGPALDRVRSYLGATTQIKVEVEVRDEEELCQAIAKSPDRIMLDNMDVTTMRRCVELVRASNPGIELEASGGISEKSIVAVAQTGVDFISCGWITHSAPALDIHLLIQ